MALRTDLIPFVNCLNPQLIEDQARKGSKQIVPCGHCVACQNTKRRNLSVKLGFEVQNNQFLEFLTLTYNDENLPLFRFSREENNSNYYTLQPCVDRIVWDDNGYDYFTNDLSDSVWSPLKVNFYNNKFRYGFSKALFDYKQYLHNSEKKYGRTVSYAHGDNIALLHYRDAQLFMKRLRKRIKTQYNEEIRYYIIGEYGTQFLRPHWHLLIFHNSYKLRNAFNDKEEVIELARRGKHFYVPKFLKYATDGSLCPCWQYGYATSESKDGGVASYVADYVNLAADFPDLLNVVRPQKAYHSIRLGSPLTKADIEQVFKTKDFANFSDRVGVDNQGHEFRFTLWRSLYNHVFPQLPHISFFGYEELYDVRQTYAKLSEYFGTRNVVEIARQVYKGFGGLRAFKSSIYTPIRYRKYVDYCRIVLARSATRVFRPFGHAYDVLLPFLYTSKHYDDMVREYHLDRWEYSCMIDDFYKYKKLEILRNHYRTCEVNELYANMYYDKIYTGLVPNLNYQDTFDFRVFKSMQLRSASKKIKHKEKVAFLNQGRPIV